MKALVLASMLAVAGLAQAQVLAPPQPLQRGPDAMSGNVDAQETRMMAVEASNDDFRAWYGSAKRPPVVLYFNRQLADMPAGWTGLSRMVIEDVQKEGGSGAHEDKRQVSVGLQVNTAALKQVKGQFAKLYEQSLNQELKRNGVHMLDGTVLHRKMAADGRSKDGDIEFESLSRSARFVFEVELVFVNGACEILASLKELRTGDITASVRQPVSSLQNAAEIDRANKALVQRLMAYKMM